MDEKRTDADHNHEGDPSPSHRAMRQRAFWRSELDNPKSKGRHGGKGVYLNGRRRIEQRR
jgi:hypothetical protein